MGRRLHPTDVDLRLQLFELLHRTDRHREAEQQLEVGRRALADRGLDDSPLVDAKAKLLRTPAPTVDAPRAKELRQEIRFCHSFDGTRIACATVGEGPPIVKAANWLTHLEFDWNSPVWRHLFTELSREHKLVRYDDRGNGLSDWDVEEISYDAFLQDLEHVVDATDLKREHEMAMRTIMRANWGADNPAYRQLFTSTFMPGAAPEQMKWFNDLQRMTASPDNALRLRAATADIDIRPLLSKVQCPTLCLHARGDAAVSYERGLALAGGIPNARFVTLESDNHLLREDEPAWQKFLSEVRHFLVE